MRLDLDKIKKQHATMEDNLRGMRIVECFSVINRGQLWYDSLSEKELIDLDDWYGKWLSVTQTLEVPEKPSWL